MIPVAHGAAADVFSASVGNVKIGAAERKLPADDHRRWPVGLDPGR